MITDTFVFVNSVLLEKDVTPPPPTIYGSSMYHHISMSNVVWEEEEIR